MSRSIHPDAAAAFVAYQEMVGNLVRLLKAPPTDERPAALRRVRAATQAAAAEYSQLNEALWLADLIEAGAHSPTGAA